MSSKDDRASLTDRVTHLFSSNEAALQVQLRYLATSPAGEDMPWWLSTKVLAYYALWKLGLDSEEIRQLLGRLAS